MAWVSTWALSTFAWDSTTAQQATWGNHSIRDRILINLVDTLKAINGDVTLYHQDIHNRSLRFSTPTFNIPEFPTILVLEPSESLTQIEGEPYRFECRMSVPIAGLISRQSNLAIGLSQMLADITVAILTDVTRGGKAVDTWISEQSTQVDQEQAPYGVASMQVEILYFVRAQDPTASG